MGATVNDDHVCAASGTRAFRGIRFDEDRGRHVAECGGCGRTDVRVTPPSRGRRRAWRLWKHVVPVDKR